MMMMMMMMMMMITISAITVRAQSRYTVRADHRELLLQLSSAEEAYRPWALA
jgi:hypothetical protein